MLMRMRAGPSGGRGQGGAFLNGEAGLLVEAEALLRSVDLRGDELVDVDVFVVVGVDGVVGLGELFNTFAGAS